MKHITMRIYSYKELDEEIKHRIKSRQWFADYMEEQYNWASMEIIQFWQEKLETMGFEVAEIQYSGFYSQGSGACFTADHKHGRITIYGRRTFPEAMMVDPHCFDWGEPMISGDKQEKILHFAKEQANKIYMDLQTAYDTIYDNDDYIGDIFDGNGIMFSVQGTPFLVDSDSGMEMYVPLY